MFRLIYLALLLLPTSLFSQNLVVNPSFEDYDSCIYTSSNDFFYPFINNWVNPNLLSPEYFNSCSINPGATPAFYGKTPRTGNAIAGCGFYQDQSAGIVKGEFIEGKLTTSLVKDSFYCIKFYVTMANDRTLAIDRIGIKFSDSLVFINSYTMPFAADVESEQGKFFTAKTTWQKAQITYKAKGAEKYFVLGNFNEFANTSKMTVGIPYGDLRDSIAYYYIDDVSVEMLPSYFADMNIGNDSLLCDTTGFSYTLSVPAIYDSVKWNTGATTLNITINKIGKYSVTGYIGDCEAKDTITFSLFPNQTSLPLADSLKVCANETPVMTGLTYQFSNYQWSNGDTTSYGTFYQSGTYYVTVTNVCDTIIDSIKIVIVPLPSPPQVSDTSVCQGSSPFELTAVGTDVTWFANINDPSPILPPVIQTDVAGMQTFYVKQNTLGYVCVSNAATVNVTIQPLPDVELGNNQSYCQGAIVTLKTREDSTFSYLWNTGDTISFINVNSDGAYWCKVSNECGSIEDEIEVTFLICDNCLYIPNAFTPNGDGNNDVFYTYTQCPLKKFYFDIYNRWGEKVFASESVNEGWDGTYKGKLAPAGVYVYHISYVYENNHGGKSKGSITLIR